MQDTQFLISHRGTLDSFASHERMRLRQHKLYLIYINKMCYFVSSSCFDLKCTLSYINLDGLYFLSFHSFYILLILYIFLPSTFFFSYMTPIPVCFSEVKFLHQNVMLALFISEH